MAHVEASIPSGESGERLTITLEGKIAIEDGDDRMQLVLFGDPSDIKMVTNLYKQSHAMTFRARGSDVLHRNGKEMAITSITGHGVRFTSGDNLSV